MNKTADDKISYGEIMVIDDSPESLKLLVDLLISSGYLVRPSEDPRLALESALAVPPDLILLDVRMPDMDGFEVCQRLKQDSRTSDVPILFVSGLDDVDAQLRGFQAGGLDYITKPVRHDEVLARVATHLTLRQKAKELEKAKQVAESASDAKSEFLRNMSHELRTPMSAIMGMSNLMLMTELNAKQRNYIEKLHISGKSLLALIEDMLDFASLESSALEVGDFILNDLMDNFVNKISVEAEKKDVQLMFTVDPDVPTALIGDQKRLAQVLGNLGNNAVKFNKPDGEVQVSVSLKNEDEKFAELHFSLSDTGIGISHDQQKILFQPFAQVDGSNTRKHGGAGLGLMYSRKLIEMMGGEIWVESEYGTGSTFHFTVRLKKQ